MNIAAIHYHYGSREELVRAVLDRVVAPINAQRIALLEQALSQTENPLDVGALLDAFLRPDLVALDQLREEPRGMAVAHFLARTYSQPTALVERLIRNQFAEVRGRFLAELARSLPDVPAAEIEWRMACVVGVVVAQFAQTTSGQLDLEASLARLIAFIAPGLAAPTPSNGRITK